MTQIKRLWRGAARLGTGLLLTTLPACAQPHSTVKAAAAPAGPVPAAGPMLPDTFRPPAVPLVTFNPYLSIWSETDRLADDVTRHWTQSANPLTSLIRIDGKTYRLMGVTPHQLPAFPQVGLTITPTRSIYDFEDTGVHVTLTFMTTALPDDLDALSRPLTYLTWSVRSVDGQAHDVSLYDATSSLLTVNEPTEPVTASRSTMGPLTALRAGADHQTLLRPAGDGVRINWGYVYAAAPSDQSTAAIGGAEALDAGFALSGTLPTADDSKLPRPANEDTPTLAFAFALGQVSAAPVTRHMMVAYDELYTVELAGKRLRPYWRRDGATPETLLPTADKDYDSLEKRCEDFDTRLTADLTQVGGPKYAQTCALAYRQSLAATGLAVDANKHLLAFTKENTSNGDIATVDVLFPTSPIWLLLSPTLAKAIAVPALAYSASPQWKFPNAPHDLGTYPIASVSGDAGEAMPVEESADMLLLCDAISHTDGSADFVKPYWPVLTKWAEYLVQYGLDPEDQLCTDDFMGHLAHNANLSVKAIVALGAYGDLCKRHGDKAGAKKYSALAHTDAAHWIKVADGGNASLLAFDKPGTWSQKYNMVWDKVLGLNIFPPEVSRKEIAFYKTQLQPYGVPLDSRTMLGDLDHSFYAASMAGTKDDFMALTDPYYDYANATPDRIALTDTYPTNTLISTGPLLHARSVVGGAFMRMLTEPVLWKKWASADPVRVSSGWAPLPKPPVVMTLLPGADTRPTVWSYTTQKPADGWTQPDFNTPTWKSGPSGFGTAGTPGLVVGTVWNTPDIWLRRTVTLPDTPLKNAAFRVLHDEDVEIYVNGTLASSETSYNSIYALLPITPAALALLKPGTTVTLAVHCHQTTGGQSVDVGLVNVTEQ